MGIKVFGLFIKERSQLLKEKFNRRVNRSMLIDNGDYLFLFGLFSFISDL